MGGWLSPWHWMFILVIAVLLFGNRLPEIARSLGRSVNEFKRGLKDVKDEFDSAANDDPPPKRLDSTAARDAAKLDHRDDVKRDGRDDAYGAEEPEKTGAVSDRSNQSDEGR